MTTGDFATEIEFVYKDARLRVSGSEAFVEKVVKNHDEWFGAFIEFLKEYPLYDKSKEEQRQERKKDSRTDDGEMDWIRRIAEDADVSYNLVRDVFEEKDGNILVVDWTEMEKPAETRKQMTLLVVYANKVGLGLESVEQKVVQASLKTMDVESRNPSRDFGSIESIRVSGKKIVMSTPGKRTAKSLLKEKQLSEEVYQNE